MRLLPLLFVLTVACDSDSLGTDHDHGSESEAVDSDGDGLTDAEEADLGTDPDLADSDSDGISDKDEVDGGTNPVLDDSDSDGVKDGKEAELGTDPNDDDSDDDGLTDGEEVALTTDPNDPDSDADGFDDGEEVDAMADPLFHGDWPRGTGRWPDNTARLNVAAPIGYGMGDQLPDAALQDQHGNTVQLHRFAGHVILIDLSAGWCGPCRSVAQHAQSEWTSRAPRGFLSLHMMIDDNSGGGGVSAGFTSEWASQYAITFPVVSDSGDTIYRGVSNSGLYEGGIPFMFLVDQDLRVADSVTGSGGERRMFSKAETLLER